MIVKGIVGLAALAALFSFDARAEGPRYGVGSIATIAFAAAPTIASTTLEPRTATVGDRLTLTVVVEHETATIIEGPRFDADYGGLEVADIPPPVSEDRDGVRRTTLTYTLAAFRTGDVTVPALTLEYRGAEGAGTLDTPPQTATITSVLAPGETELKPLKPQLAIDAGAPSPLVPAMFVAMFAALTAFGYVLYRRAAGILPAPIPVAPVPPPTAAEAARSALDDLAASGIADDDAPEYYARLAAIVRRYLSARFDFPAYAMTRTELERGMTPTGIDRWPARLTGNLLEQCDAVEFAKFDPAPERRVADLTAAYEIIELTRDDRTPAVGEDAPHASAGT